MLEWPALMAAARRAAAGRRGRRSVAAFEFTRADEILHLQHELLTGSWRHQPYVHFAIHEPKHRIISAAAFRDRIVHHALCAVIEPRFERLFIADSYANRRGKGTHRAVQRMAELVRAYPYVLRMDIRQHFPSIDHQILLDALATQLSEPELMMLCRRILASADDPEVRGPADAMFFAGDDLFAACRPRGLPIGNLTSQFWSNVVMHAFDLFVTRELRCTGYLRYVDDFALFGHSKAELWACKKTVVERLARLRLRAHEHSAQVAHTCHGVPWLGFVVSPQGLKVKSRKVRQGTRHLAARYDAMREGRISFAEFDATVQGWINHVRWGDVGEGLRRHVLEPFVLPAGARPRGRS
jgi:hypothetical protein